ncbi:insulin-like growth factor-binding protein 6 isoform X1 [Haliaeetus albicilla]
MRAGYRLMLLVLLTEAAPVAGNGGEETEGTVPGTVPGPVPGTATVSSPRGPGEPCGVYTPGCARGLRCIPRPGERAPLRALLRGTGLCRPLRARPAGTGAPAGSVPGAFGRRPAGAAGRAVPHRLRHLPPQLRHPRLLSPQAGGGADGAPRGAMSRGERETLLALQQALTEEQFQTLKYLLEERLPLAQLRPATRPDLCSLLLQRFPGQALRITADLLRQIHRHDLIRLHQLPGAEENEDPGEKGEAGGPSALSGRGEEDAGRQPVSLPAASSPLSLRPRRLTEKDLIQVAQKLGKEWQEVGIGCLGLERSRLDQIREDNPRNVVMQSFEMLREWRRREKQEATAPRLYACLAPASLDPEVLDLLQSFQGD